jgi:hypothetical protein
VALFQQAKDSRFREAAQKTPHLWSIESNQTAGVSTKETTPLTRRGAFFSG